MNNLVFGILMLAGTASAIYTDVPGKLKGLYDESIATAQLLATAGDLRSISTMLDVHYLKTGRLPKKNGFGRWLAVNFKESNLKDLRLDHWGHPYIYMVDAKRKHYIIASRGPDGVAGNDDDISKTGP